MSTEAVTQRCSVKKVVLKYFAKSTRDWLQPSSLLKKTLWHTYFLLEFFKFLKNTFFKEHFRWLLLSVRKAIKKLNQLRKFKNFNRFILKHWYQWCTVNVEITYKIRTSFKGGMYRVCGSRLGLNFEVRLTTDRICNLWFQVQEMRESAVFKETYLRPCGSSSTNFSKTVNCRNSKIKIQNEIIEIKMIEIQIQFVIKQIFLLCQQRTCLFANNWLSHKLSTALNTLIKNTH